MQDQDEPRELRADAERNRAALLRAAEEVFTEQGAGAPLALVTERAGLGRGTLYRHFPSRADLVEAIYGERLNRYENYARKQAQTAAAGEALFHVLEMIAWDQFSIPDLLRVIEENSADSPRYAALWARTESVVGQLLDAARSAGTVRAGVTEQDVILVISMFYGVANSPSVGRWGRAAVDRSLQLIRKILT